MVIVDQLCDTPPALFPATRIEDTSSHPHRRWCPEESAGWLSKLLFVYVDGLIKKGSSKHLEQNDLWDVAHNNEAANVYRGSKAILKESSDPVKAPQVPMRGRQQFVDGRSWVHGRLHACVRNNGGHNLGRNMCVCVCIMHLKVIHANHMHALGHFASLAVAVTLAVCTPAPACISPCLISRTCQANAWDMF